ncbi:hypothetical protein BSNT_10009 [Bacillus subtilis subsp. natto BEST195]|nr:hypothetical protein BSNT_10009 [Bacillus subtilis subsp. natto BEST195]
MYSTTKKWRPSDQKVVSGSKIHSSFRFSKPF